MSDPRPMLWPRPVWAGVLAIYAALVILPYAQTLNDPFHLDDHHVFADYTAADMWGKCRYLPRIVTHASFALDASLHGKARWGYHLVNIVIHLFTAFAVFLMFSASRPPPPSLRTENQLGQLWREPAFSGPFFAGLVFLLHPLATHSVSYLAQRYALLAGLFYFASLYAFLRARTIAENNTFFSAGHITWYIASFAAAVLAMLSKEFAVSLVCMFLLAEWCFHQDSKRAWTRRLAYLLPLLSTGSIILYFQFIWTDGSVQNAPSLTTTQNFQFAQAAEIQYIPRLTYFATEVPVILTEYVRLLLVPIGQSVDHAYTMYESIWAGPVVICGLVLVAMLLAGFWLHRRQPYIAFALLAIFLTLGPTSSFIPNTELVAEQRTYLTIVAVSALMMAWHVGSTQARLQLWSMLIVGVLALATTVRNQVWDNDVALWGDAARKAPNKPRPQFAYGTALLRAGQTDAAEQALKAAIQANPEYGPPHNNLGNLYQIQGKLELAQKHYQLATTYSPAPAEAFYNLALLDNKQDRLDEAVKNSLNAIYHQSEYPEAYYNLGLAYDKMGKLTEALEAYAGAYNTTERQRANPIIPHAHYATGDLLERQGQLEEARKHYERALALLPTHAYAALRLGKLAMANGALEQAERLLKRTLGARGHHQGKALTAIGQIQIQRARLGIAVRCFQDALKLNPNHAAAHYHLATALAMQDDADGAKKHLETAIRLGYEADAAFVRKLGVRPPESLTQPKP